MSRPTSVNNQFPHVGLAAYFTHTFVRDRVRVERVAELLVDSRWPWIPWWAEFSGIHKRDDRTSVRVGGKNGIEPLVNGLMSPRLRTLYMDRAKGDKNFTSVRLPFDPEIEDPSAEAPYKLWITCRSAELPEGKTFADWITLAHDLVAAVGALNATLGAWPTYDLAIGDTWLTRVILDTAKGDIPLNDPPGEFMTQRELLKRWSHKLGRTYARHPRWGTYLNATHVAAIGGVERIRAEVQPARIDPVGDLTYIQLTDAIETGMSPQAGERRRKLQALMDPILLGAGQPPRPADG
jgi:hypothetical protein